MHHKTCQGVKCLIFPLSSLCKQILNSHFSLLSLYIHSKRNWIPLDCDDIISFKIFSIKLHSKPISRDKEPPTELNKMPGFSILHLLGEKNPTSNQQYSCCLNLQSVQHRSIYRCNNHICIKCSSKYFIFLSWCTIVRKAASAADEGHWQALAGETLKQVD